MYIDWESVIAKGFIAFLVIAAIVLIAALPFAIVGGLKAKESFMAECLEDGKKQYECTAMWRSGESNGAVMPMPLIIR